MTDPIRPTDDEARALARTLLQEARFAAIAVLERPGQPMVTRVAFGLDPNGQPLTLISDLSHHTKALRADPACSLLVGEPGPKGDPLTHPRLTLQVRASFTPHSDPAYADLARHYLRTHPKAKLYIDFTDFSFARLTPQIAYLNGGFGKAYRLKPDDLV